MTDSPVCWTRSEMGSGRKHYSIRTEQGYVEEIRCFVLHYNERHPREMGAAEVEAFPTRLAAAERVSLVLGS